MRIATELNIAPMSSKSVIVRKYGKAFYKKNYVEYKKKLFALLKSQLQDIEINKDTPIKLDIIFYKNKIEIVIETIDNDKEIYNTDKPDIDNLLKPLLDELKYAIKVDDSKIVCINAKKLV